MDFHAQLAWIALDQAHNVFFSAASAVPKARRFLTAVPNQHLEKPFEPASLYALVDERLRKRGTPGILAG